jgi:threonylcarbamoyladenosine tRNA methylthiotransferase MtaB
MNTRKNGTALKKGVGSNFLYPQSYPQKIGSDPFFKLYTLGCKVNQYETQEIRERFLEAGFKEASKNNTADIYIVNTCTVTQKADRESLYHIHRSHRENPQARIIVTGCLAELDSSRIRREPGVSFVIKNKDKNKIVSKILQKPVDGSSGISNFAGHTRAFLKIQDGCNNFCSYCKVPLVRGISRSKALPGIIEEARRLVSNGYREIVLTGICLGSYGQDLKARSSLVRVIDELEKIEGLLRIRLSSIEAKDVSDALILKMAASKKLCRHMHIPIQSGDDEILSRMHRKYTRQDYIRLITKIKKAVPRIAITTDVLVGFPGEEEHHFRSTLDLVEKITPLRTHIFSYSARPGTQACSLKGSVPLDIVKDRLMRIKKTADNCAMKFQKRFLNRILPVLIESPVKGCPGYWEGYTDNYIKIRCRSSKSLKNKLISLLSAKVQGEIIFATLP